MKLSERIAEMVKGSSAKTAAWGSYVSTVDSAKMGKLARSYRIERGAPAVSVGKLMGISKVRIYFLEKGRTAWTLALLTEYLNAVDKSVKNGLSKVSTPAATAKKTGPAGKGR